MQDLNLAGRIAVVTRAVQVNGPAICEALGRQGAKIVLGDTSSANLAEEAQRLSNLGVETLSLETDVSQVNQIEHLLGQAVQAYGRVDIMVNNTRVNESQPAETLAIDTFRQDVIANVNPVFFGCQIAARQMLAQEPVQTDPYPVKGAIINIASVAGVVAIPGQAAFCAAMGGIIAMTNVLAAEWGPQGVRVVAVGVGITESLLEKAGLAEQPPSSRPGDGTASPAETYMTLLANAPRGYIPVGVPASPAAVGRAVAYLASEAAGYTTGTTLYTDGGWLAYGYL